MTRRNILRAALVMTFILLPLAVLAHMLWLARSEPVMRYAEVSLPDWPEGQPAVRIVLAADSHVAGPDMHPSRLAGIVQRINSLKPDLVLLAGDFVSDKKTATRHYSTEEAVAPLGGLEAPLGTIAVLGNHDHSRDATAVRDALRRHGLTVLDNEAVQRGPFAIGGVGDDMSGHADVAKMLGALDSLQGARLILSHSPDIFPELPDTAGLTVAGHTHCGQIVLPWLGPLTTASRYGRRYACGLIREGSRVLVITAGLGTSILPLRLGARPDLWVLTVGSLGHSDQS